MPVQLYFSNSPVLLLDRLERNLDFSEPFRSPSIATPTPAMKRWVQMRLAERRGIIANVKFMHLERTLWQRLEELDQYRVVEERQPAMPLDEHAMQLLILGRLRRLPPDSVNAYLREDAGETSARVREALYSRRLCQLSAKLAGFFREYEYNRVHTADGKRGLASLWMEGKDCFAEYFEKGDGRADREQARKLEAWQKEIYSALFRETEGVRDRLGEKRERYAYTLPQYAEMVLRQKRDGSPAGPAPAFHLFGLSQISPFHMSLIRRLADDTELTGRAATFHVYSLNPCGEFWEDVLSPKGRHRIEQQSLFNGGKYREWWKLRADGRAAPADFLHLEDNPLLGNWGGPWRDNLTLWNDERVVDIHEHFHASTKRTLLSAVQTGLLRRLGPLPEDERVPQDGSLRVMACPEIQREVETAYHGIVEDLLTDPSMRPDEIAVMVPDLEKYRHELAAVFDRFPPGTEGHVPHSLSGAASSESEYARGVRAIFALARGRFSRKEIFALADNACFRLAAGLPEEALHAWAAWTGALNVFHSFDAEDKARRGYLRDPDHTWARGIDRLALGAVMESPRAEDERNFAGLVPFADGRTPDRDLVNGFIAAVEGLHRALAPFRPRGEDEGRDDASPLKPWKEWIDLLGPLIESHLAAPPDEAMETRVRFEVRRCLAELAEMDDVDALCAAGGGPAAETPAATAVTADIPLDLVLARLDGLKAGREGHMPGGVQIGTLSSLRSLPFKSVYLLGLGEGQFPEDAATSTLDLRRYKRIPGDVEPAARNRWLFLETMVCAQEKLSLSYVSRDVLQGKEFQMSSVLNELLDHVEADLLPSEDGARGRFRTIQAPLLSRDPTLFAAPSGDAASVPRNLSREERLLSWLEAKRKRAPADFFETARSGLPAALRRVVFPPRREAAAPAQGGAKDKVFLRELRDFLRNPVECTLKRRLDIDDWREEDETEKEDEPFSTDKRLEREVLERVFNEAVDGWEKPGFGDVWASFRDFHEGLARRGCFPEGIYRELDRELLWKRAEAALAEFGKVAEGFDHGGVARMIRGVSFGEAGRYDRVGEMKCKPVRLEGVDGFPGGAAHIHGVLPNLFLLPGGGSATFVPVVFRMRLDRLLVPFLFYLSGLLSEEKVGDALRSGPFVIHYVHRNGEQYASATWPPRGYPGFRIDPETAREYLRGLVAATRGTGAFDNLPLGIIQDELLDKPAPKMKKWEGRLKARAADYPRALREALEDADPGDEFAAFRPRETTTILSPAVPDDAFEKIQARFGLFFGWAA